MRSIWSGSLVGSVALLAVSVAMAQGVGDSDYTQGYTLKAVPLSFGGAYRAIADTNAAILMNPAGLAQRKGEVAVSGDYISNGATSSHAFGVAISDYKTTDLLALAFSYDRDQFIEAGTGVTAQQFTLAAARELGSIVYLGAALKGYISSVDTTLVTAPDSVDLDLGLLVKPLPLLSLAITTQNLFNGWQYEEFPFTLGFGAAVNLAPYGKIAVDVVRDFATPAPQDINAYFGGEIQPKKGIAFRGGFGLDNVRDNNFYALGLAAVGPKVSFVFTFSQHLNPTKETYAGSLEFAF